LLGAPGAGKGTQAKLMEKEYNIPQISTGDIFRAAIKEGTELGMLAKKVIDKGELVPDDITVGIVKERLNEKDCENGFILDGFPRTLPQAEAFDKEIEKLNKHIDYVLNIDVPENEVIKRISSRYSCKSCGAIFSELTDDISENKCLKCGGELYQRDDDKPETVKNRLNVYNNQTAPLINYYKEKGKLKTINGVQKVDDIFKEIKNILGR
jgi:adenylate kinase